MDLLQNQSVVLPASPSSSMDLHQNQSIVLPASPSSSMDLPDNSSDLHDSILICILVKLPLKSVITCKLVCKSWYHLISDSRFAHVYNSAGPFKCSLYFEYCSDEICLIETGKEVLETSFNVKQHLPTSKDQILGIVGSCNGLFCFLVKTRLPVDRFEGTVFVYNPLTCEYIEILETCVRRDVFYSTKFGFGCSKYTDQYKVFSFLPEEDRMILGSRIQGQIFTVGVDSRWREYEGQSVEVEVEVRISDFKDSVLFNGVLHWVGNEVIAPADNVIYAFDLEEEKSVIIHLPPPLQSFFNNKPFVGILNDHLCAVGEEDCSCVWIMKDYGVVESWTKYIVVKDPIPQHSFFLYPGFVCIVASHAFAEEEDTDSRMFACNGEIEHMILGQQSRCQALPYVPCFSSLEDVVKGGNPGVRKT